MISPFAERHIRSSFWNLVQLFHQRGKEFLVGIGHPAICSGYLSARVAARISEILDRYKEQVGCGVLGVKMTLS